MTNISKKLLFLIVLGLGISAPVSAQDKKPPKNPPPVVTPKEKPPTKDEPKTKKPAFTAVLWRSDSDQDA